MASFLPTGFWGVLPCVKSNKENLIEIHLIHTNLIHSLHFFKYNDKLHLQHNSFGEFHTFTFVCGWLSYMTYDNYILFNVLI